MFKTYKFKELTLTASSYNTKITIEIPSDSSANEYFEAFRTLMIGMGFLPQSFDNAVEAHYTENIENREVLENRETLSDPLK
jgi:hypothetical protein